MDTAVRTPPAMTLLAIARQRTERRIYIAGPMTGLPDLNFPAFEAAAAILRAEGWHVENPSDHGVIFGMEWQDYLRYDLGRLATCSAIYLLPGWSKSNGAMLEVHIARQLEMTILLAPGAEPLSPPPITKGESNV